MTNNYPRRLQIGSCTVDFGACLIHSGDEEVRVEPKIMDVLACLVAASGALVSKDELLDQVWGDVYVTDAVVFRSIAHLRKVLGTPGNGAVITTVRGRGYRLSCSVAPATDGVAGDIELPDCGIGDLEVAERVSPMAAPRRFPRLIAAAAIAAAAVIAIARMSAGSGGSPAPDTDAILRRAHEAYARVDRAGVEASIRHYEQALGLDPELGLAHSGLAAALVQKHGLFDHDPELLERAEAEAVRGLALAPREAEAHRAAGLVYSARGHLAAAGKAFEQAIDLDRGQVAAKGNLANVMLLTGRLDESLAQWRNIGDGNMPRWVQLVNRSAPQILMSDLPTARATLEEALSLAPNQPRVVANLAMVDHYEGRLDHALRRINAALQARPESALLWTARGDLESLLPDYAAAETSYQRALSLSPAGSVDTDLGLAFIAAVTGKSETATSITDRIGAAAVQRLDRGDEGFGPRLWLARSAAINGHDADAFRWLQRAVDHGLSNTHWIATAPELAQVRQAPGFATWMSALQARIRGMRERSGVDALS